MPDRSAPVVSVTSTSPAYQPLASGAGTAARVLGAVRSILMSPTVALVPLPARSITEALADNAAPSPLTVLSAGGSPSRPESASEAVQRTVTSPLYQPLPFGALVGAPLRLGAVLSMLMPLRLALAELSAASAAVPSALWFAPSPFVTAGEQPATPESS